MFRGFWVFVNEVVSVRLIMLGGEMEGILI
jgi:hypothetical protein